MKEYIDRAAALDICQKEYEDRLRMSDYCGDTVAYNIAGAIKSIPAADVVEVRHGKLKNGGNGVYDTCTACESEIYLVMEMNYCPICGVKWDKEDTDEIQE